MERTATENSQLQSRSNVSSRAQKMLDDLEEEAARGSQDKFSGLESELDEGDQLEEPSEDQESEEDDIDPADVVIKSSDLIYQPES